MDNKGLITQGQKITIRILKISTFDLLFTDFFRVLRHWIKGLNYIGYISALDLLPSYLLQGTSNVTPCTNEAVEPTSNVIPTSSVVIFRFSESFISTTTIPVRCQSELIHWSCKHNIFRERVGVIYSSNRRSRLFIGS